MIKIEDLKCVKVQPGDIFVLKVPGVFTDEEVADIKETWARSVGPHVPLVILAAGAELMLYREAV